MSTPHDAGMPGRPVPPQAKSGSRPWLIAAITVLSLALMAMLWFGIRPMLLGGGAPKSSGVGVNPSDSGQPVNSDTFGPMSWSAPLTIADGRSCSQPGSSVTESGIDGIDLVSCESEGVGIYLYAVDSSTMQLLWSSSTTYANVDAVTPDGLIIRTTDSLTEVVLDPRTGNNVGHPFQGFTGAVSVEAGMIVTAETYDASGFVMCGRTITAPDSCVWTKSTLGQGAVSVFGGGAWADLGSWVVDVVTGVPAPFGQGKPAGIGGFFYDGPARDRIVRMTISDQNDAEVQLWNTQTDTGIGPASVVGGYYSSLIYDTELPDYLVIGSDTTLHAYSWKTGEQQWQTTLGPDIQSLIRWNIYGNTVLVWQDPQISPNSVWAIDAITGNIIGHDRTSGTFSGVIAGVAYMTDGATLTAVDATTLAPLGSIAYPAPNSWVGVVGGHVAAVTQSGQYYALQT